MGLQINRIQIHIIREFGITGQIRQLDIRIETATILNQNVKEGEFLGVTIKSRKKIYENVVRGTTREKNDRGNGGPEVGRAPWLITHKTASL